MLLSSKRRAVAYPPVAILYLDEFSNGIALPHICLLFAVATFAVTRVRVQRYRAAALPHIFERWRAITNVVITNVVITKAVTAPGKGWIPEDTLMQSSLMKSSPM
jgi:hypothetical protein